MSYDSGKSSTSMESFIDSDYYGSSVGRNDVTNLLTSSLRPPSPRSSRRQGSLERPITPTFVGTAQIYLTATPVPAEDEGYIPGTPRPSSPCFTSRPASPRPSSPCPQSTYSRSHRRMSSGYSSGPQHDTTLEDTVDDEELLHAPPPKSSFLTELRRAASPLPSKPHFGGLHDGFSIQTDHNGLRIRPRSVCGLPSRASRTYESPVATPRSLSARPSRPLTRSHSTAEFLTPGSSTSGSCEKCESDPLDQTLERSYNGSSLLDRSLCDHRVALHESEHRRHLLVDRLKDAQETIEMQARRMTKSTSFAKTADTELVDLKNKERELQAKIGQLEKERQHHITVNNETQRSREHLQTRMETLEQQIRVLQAQCQVFQAETKNKQEAVDSMTSNMAALRQDYLHLRKVKDTLTKEAAELHQSNDVLTAQTQWYENNTTDHKSELQQLRQENQVLRTENRDVAAHLGNMKSARSQLNDETAALQTMLVAVKEEKQRLTQEIAQLRNTIAEIQSKLSIATMEKERHLQEKLELQMRMQNLSTDKQCLQVSKSSLEEQIADLTLEASRARSHAESQNEATRRIQEELAATKKASEMLSLELSSTKSRLEKLSESNNSLEQSKRLAFQQHSVYEQEISSLEAQIGTLKKSLENLRKEHLKEKEVLDDRILKLKEDVRKVKGERNQLEIRVHELESTNHRKEETRQYAADGQMKEMQSLQANCELLTTSLTQKNTEMLTLMEKANELEEECTQLREHKRGFTDQQKELTEAREQLNRLREDTHRMVQERSENRQVIDLLEMQKSILEKTQSECQLSKSHDQDKLQQQLNKVTSECNLMRTKSKKLEQEHRDFADGHQNCVSKMEYNVLQSTLTNLECSLDKQKSDYDELELRYRSLLQEATEWRAIGGGHEKLRNAERDRASLEAQVSLLKSQLTLLENSKQRSEDQLHETQGQLREMQEQHHQKNCNQTGELERFRLEAKQYKSKYEKSQAMEAKLEAVIYSLREELEEEKTKKPSRLRQSLDEVGGELMQMRTELQTLLEVIQVKDQAIEDLENQLRISRQQMQSRDSSVTGSHDGHLLLGRESSTFTAGINDKEREALTEKISQLTKERDIALQDSADLREGLDDLQAMLDEEKEKLVARHQREMRAKDRQIESLEEQLQCYTRSNLKKLRRDAGRVELLRAENKVLQAQLNHPPPGATNGTITHDSNPSGSPPDENSDSLRHQSESLQDDDLVDFSDYTDFATEPDSENKDDVYSAADVATDKCVQKAVQLLNKASTGSVDPSCKIVKADMVRIKNKQVVQDGNVIHSVSEKMVQSMDCGQIVQKCPALLNNSDPPGSPCSPVSPSKPLVAMTVTTTPDSAAADSKQAASHFQAAANKDTDSLQYISEDDTIQTDSEFSFDDESFGGGSRRGSGVTGALRLAEAGHADKQASSPSRSSSLVNVSSRASSTTSGWSVPNPVAWPKFQKSYRSMYQSQMHLDKLGVDSDTASFISQDNISDAASNKEPQRRFSTPAYCLTTKPSKIKTIEEDREKAGGVQNNNRAFSKQSAMKPILGNHENSGVKPAAVKRVTLCVSADNVDGAKLSRPSNKEDNMRFSKPLSAKPASPLSSPNTRRKAGSLDDLNVSALQNDSGVISQSGSESCESLPTHGETSRRSNRSPASSYNSPTISTVQKRLPPRLLPKPKLVNTSRFFNAPAPTKSEHSPKINNKPEWKF